MITLGVDPGLHSGAACLLDGQDRVLCWWTWLRVVSGLRLSSPGGIVVYDRVGQIGAHVRQAREWERVAVEGLFVPRGRSPAGFIELAEATGALCGGLDVDPRGIHRPTAGEWRSRQLGLRPSTPAKEAEAYAVRTARTVFRWPRGKVTTKVEAGALAEAAWIARDGWTVAREAA